MTMGSNTKQPEEVPEVAAYEEAAQVLEAFKQNNEQVFATYSALVDDVNQKREAADKVVRAQQISCGDWDLYQWQTKYDAKALFEALGRDGFMAVGGKMKKVTEFDLDKAKFKMAVSGGEVPEEVADAVISVSPRYHAPKAL
jgi:hypothetical protein